MELIFAAILGIVQGLTEFLPISSSAHLILIPWLMGWTPEGIAFDVSLHVGTAAAVLVYFWREWYVLGLETIRGIAARDLLGNPQRRLAWFLIIGSIPAAVIGLAFEEQVENTLRSPLVTVITLIALAIVLYFADRKGRKNRSLDQFNWGDSIWIGMSQAVALIPGVSRSGITMSTALLRDATRTSAARFSFLLSTPVIVGAGMLEAWQLFDSTRITAVGGAGPVEIQWPVLAIGTACAAITGFLCIRYFLRYLQSGSFLPFVLYRFVLAAVVLYFHLR